MNQKKGFTLIELLVVVLIIGILSAIALPQYTLAVEKSRIAEANIVLKSLVDACTRYCLENGCTDDTTPCKWDNIDIAIELQETSDSYMRQSKYFFYALDTPGYDIYAGRGELDGTNDYILGYVFNEGYNYSTGNRYCHGQTDFGKKVCKSLCGADDCNY